MKLDENYTLTGKKYNWTLEYEKDTGEVTEEGKPIISRDKWYFPKLEQVMSRYIEEATRPLPDAVAILNKLKEIDETIKNIKIKNNL